MNYIPRQIESVIAQALRRFPAAVLTGPRRAGKTVLLRHAAPQANYFLLEDPDLLLRARSDPRGFLDGIEPPAILDEIQQAPELLAYIRTRIDAAPRRTGQWLLTGSQESSLMQGVTESLAGRAAILHLLPFSQSESPKAGLWSGGFPEVLARPGARDLWFSSYIQTYLERDVRSVLQVRDLSAFRRFMGLAASRHGQVLNKTDLAAPLGLSVPTVGHWLGVLETTGLIALLPPYFENLGKRLIKSPKLYWLDSGLVANLLGLRSRAEMERSPFIGALWEGFVASEIIKRQINRGERRELYYFRDEQGLEVDFLLPGHGGRWDVVETKSGRTVTPVMARPLQALATAMGPKAGRRWILHRPGKDRQLTRALAPGVSAGCLEDFWGKG